ncbi:radical SAM family heme chaperone HemW [Flavobacteriaceae bacterium]|nr:radical SAM family heme chaperone HemW [Flavobacteriaceae bacterium]
MASVYFHVPFCKQACHYCNFHFSTSLKNKNLLLKAMLRELELRKAEFSKTERVNSIYFGGGTPSLLSAIEIKMMIDAVKTNFDLASEVEITLEMNPDDDRQNYLKELKEVGINRMSIGVQSFFDDELKLMNRAHSADEAFLLLKKVKELFDNFSLDLIYGMPLSNLEKWKKNIELALRFEPNHISSYALTIEPKTVLSHQVKKQQVEVLDDDEVLKQFNFLIDRLEKEGYEHYELSSFGKPNFQSVNNSAYWSGKSYLGIGPSAHSFDGNTRSWNISNNAKYINGISTNIPFIEREILNEIDRYNEYLMTGLRTKNGISLSYIEEKFGHRYKELLEKEAQNHITSQMLYWDGDVLKVSRKAKFLVDGLASDLFILNN